MNNHKLITTPTPLLGADFLCAYELPVDLKHHCLIGDVTLCSYACTLSGADSSRLSRMLSATYNYLRLLAEFLVLTEFPVFAHLLVVHCQVWGGAPHSNHWPTGLHPGQTHCRQGRVCKHGAPWHHSSFRQLGFTPPHRPEAWRWVTPVWRLLLTTQSCTSRILAGKGPCPWIPPSAAGFPQGGADHACRAVRVPAHAIRRRLCHPDIRELIPPHE